MGYGMPVPKTLALVLGFFAWMKKDLDPKGAHLGFMNETSAIFDTVTRKKNIDGCNGNDVSDYNILYKSEIERRVSQPRPDYDV